MSEIVDAYDERVAAFLPKPMQVPYYQRDYEWQPKTEVNAMLEDLFEHFDTGEAYGSGSEDDYILGPMVVTSGERAELIDGQQRSLTLFVLMAALRSRLLQLDPDSALAANLPGELTEYVDEAAEVQSRLRHHDPFVHKLLTSLISLGATDDIPKESTDSISARGLLRAYRHILLRITDELPNRATKVTEFASFIRTHVKIIKTVTGSPSQALIIFERANDRGKPLDPSDLLKNLIFQQLDRAQFAEVDRLWKEVQNVIDNTPNVNMIDFLRWFHMASPGGFYSTKRSFYPELKKNASRIGLLSDPIAYVNRLQEHANRLQLMAAEQKNPVSREPSKYLQGIHALGGGRQKQHWPLMLVAARWGEQQFEDVAQDMERYLFAAYVTDLRSQRLERTIRDFVANLRDLDSSSARILRSQELFNSETQKIRDEFFFSQRFEALSYDTSRHVVRFVLVRINDSLLVQYSGGSFERGNGASDDYQKAQIEHIWPQSDADTLDPDNPDLVNTIGNLTLLDQSYNASAGAKPADEKLHNIYPSAKERFMVTRNLLAHQTVAAVGRELAYNQAIRHCPTGFLSWNVETIAELATSYLALIDEAMPPSLPN